MMCMCNMNMNMNMMCMCTCMQVCRGVHAVCPLKGLRPLYNPTCRIREKTSSAACGCGGTACA